MITKIRILRYISFVSYRTLKLHVNYVLLQASVGAGTFIKKYYYLELSDEDESDESEDESVEVESDVCLCFFIFLLL